MISKNFEENRARFSLDDLKRYEGQWVAFSQDGSRIIAGNKDLLVLEKLIRAAGEEPGNVGLERIEFEDTYLGGADLH